MNCRIAALLGALALGCQPSIGDHCVLSTDCSSTGQRVCDPSQLNGYCTINNCLPNQCPSGSGCILTNPSLLGCPYDDRHAPSRSSHQYCAKLCGQDSDCRVSEGYACITPSTYGVLVIDNDQTEKVCMQSTTYVVVADASDDVAPVCSVSGPPVPPYEAGPGYQGDEDAAADASDDDASDAGTSDAATDALGD